MHGYDSTIRLAQRLTNSVHSGMLHEGIYRSESLPEVICFSSKHDFSFIHTNNRKYICPVDLLGCICALCIVYMTACM